MALEQPSSSDLPQKASNLFTQQGKHTSTTTGASQDDGCDRDPEKAPQELWSIDHHDAHNVGLHLGDVILCMGCGRIHACPESNSSTNASTAAHPPHDESGTPDNHALEEDISKAPDSRKITAGSEQPPSSSPPQDDSMSLARQGEHTSAPGPSSSTAATASHTDNLDSGPEKSPQEPWSPDHHDVDDLGIQSDKTVMYDEDGGTHVALGPVTSTSGMPAHPRHPETARITANIFEGRPSAVSRPPPLMTSRGKESPRSQSAELATSPYAAEHDIAATPSPLPTPGKLRSYSDNPVEVASRKAQGFVGCQPQRYPGPIFPERVGKTESTHNGDPAFSAYAEEHKHLGDSPPRSPAPGPSYSAGSGEHEHERHSGEGMKEGAGQKKEGIIEKMKHVLGEGEEKEGK